jgi:hypothetical protein
VTGRKHCVSPHHCGARWLLCTEFYVREWNEDKTEPVKLMSWCKACQRIGQRTTAGIRRRGRPFNPADAPGSYGKPTRRLAPSVKRSRRRRHYRDKVDPRLPFDPFQRWLLVKIADSSVKAVAKRVRVSWKRVANMRDGWEYKEGGWYSILHIRLSTVEKFMNAYGEVPTQLYDRYVIEHYRAELFTQRSNR